LGGGNCPAYSRKLGTGINVDVRAGENVDVVANFEEPLPLPSGEFRLVFSRFVLEHVSWRKLPQFISEIYRILKVGGKAIIITANLLEQAKVLVHKNVWDWNELCMVFGDQDYSENSHKSSLSPELAVRLFKSAGFGTVIVTSLQKCVTDMQIEVWKGAADMRADWVRSQLGENDKIVDVGCADGGLLRGHRRNIVYVDQNLNLLPNFVQVDASNLSTVFLDKQFDVAVLAELLEHVADPVAVLRSVWKVAKRLVITVPNEYEWTENNEPFKNKGHIRFYTAEMLREHLREAGLQNFSLERLSVTGWSWFCVVVQENKL